MDCFVHPALFPLPSVCKELDSLVCGCKINPSAIELYKSAKATKNSTLRNALFLDAYCKKKENLMCY